MSLKKTKYAEYIRDFTAIGNPFLLLLVGISTLVGLPHTAHNLLILIGAFLFNEVFCSSIKYFWHKPRPNGQKYANGFEKIDAGSFPSIHASRIALVYLSLGILQYNAGNKYVFFMFIIVILIVGYSRTFLKKHFWTDVLAGWTLGTIQSLLLVSYLLK
jgi:undecaprenyl-diphosphatase